MLQNVVEAIAKFGVSCNATYNGAVFALVLDTGAGSSRGGQFPAQEMELSEGNS